MKRARYYHELPWPLRLLVVVGFGRLVLRYDLRDLLRRAHEGEDPETLYIEAYVNADHEEVEDA